MHRLVGFLLAVVLSVGAQADWKPGANPDPREILKEAREDTAAGRYEDALAKHVWFHENALTYAPELGGVRLYFAVAYWARLGAYYPPALDKLRRIRDDQCEAISNAKDEPAEEIARAFNDFSGINRTLGDEARTVALFVWLDANKPQLAKAVYEIAETALIAEKEYAICGKYLDEKTLERLVSAREMSMKEAASAGRIGPEELKRFNEFVEMTFSMRTATLVALLTLNNRNAEAERIVLEAEKVRSDREFREQLARALKGEIPTL
jgi:hypothetical protein